MAEITGLTLAALRQYEQGRNEPNLESTKKLLKAPCSVSTATGFCLMKLNPRPGRLYRLSHTLGKAKRNHPAPARRLVNGSPGIYFPEL
ncbi:helix-turn-helix transcriptional regulator [Escherichia coli]|nr:helix-turn-helix transcriptional regulator [Escherichia coli]